MILQQRDPLTYEGPFPSVSTELFPHSSQLPTRSCYPCFYASFCRTCVLNLCCLSLCQRILERFCTYNSVAWFVLDRLVFVRRREERTKQKLQLTKSIHIHNGALASHRFIRSSNCIYFIHFFKSRFVKRLVEKITKDDSAIDLNSTRAFIIFLQFVLFPGNFSTYSFPEPSGGVDPDCGVKFTYRRNQSFD